jgi:hypothetical protein
MTRVFESARSIEFEDAMCLGLREHFKCDSKSTGHVDDTYAWLMELTILPKKITVTGANVLGRVLSDDFKTVIDFEDNMNNIPDLRLDKYNATDSNGQSVGTPSPSPAPPAPQPQQPAAPVPQPQQPAAPAQQVSLQQQLQNQRQAMGLQPLP